MPIQTQDQTPQTEETKEARKSPAAEPIKKTAPKTEQPRERVRGQNKTPKNKRKKNSTALTVLFVLFAAVFLLSSAFIISDRIRAGIEMRAFENLASLIRGGDGGTVGLSLPPADLPADVQSEENESGTDAETVGVLSKYAELLTLNRDFYAWISIEDTALDLPVMYTPSDPQKYLRRAFDGSYSVRGVPFIDAGCRAGGGHYIVYGHQMNDGSIFGSLEKYGDPDYLAAHPIIRFDTFFREGSYEIIGAFYAKSYTGPEENAFPYYTYTDLTDKRVFDEYLSKIAERTVLDFPPEAEFGDELLTLSTCSGYTADGRFAVVAKRIVK